MWPAGRLVGGFRVLGQWAGGFSSLLRALFPSSRRLLSNLFPTMDRSSIHGISLFRVDRIRGKRPPYMGTRRRRIAYRVGIKFRKRIRSFSAPSVVWVGNPFRNLFRAYVGELRRIPLSNRSILRHAIMSHFRGTRMRQSYVK